ncbi:MAG: YkoF family thiamine/hydroxymethylpyrimidine-binding protein [Stellaceae bacterium]
MISSAQVSMYPLRQERVGPAIEAVRLAFEARGLKPEIGPMSTYVVGEDDLIFAALTEAFAKAASRGEVVMTITLSNACPIAG